jgi:hypothetical protein
MEHALSAAEVLDVWERARSVSRADCALLLAASAGNGASRDELAQLDIGRRDAQLLNLREKLFGPRMTGRANCPACAQAIEMNFSVAEIRAGSEEELAPQFTTRCGEYEVTFRLPNTNDLATLIAGDNIVMQKRCLAQRCVLSATRDGQALAFPELPNEAINTLSERMSELDPQGDVQLALTCPRCSHRWDSPLDVVSFVWTEVQAHAAQLLRDVHVLASNYGWREAEILTLSPVRRQAYLELIAQ